MNKRIFGILLCIISSLLIIFGLYNYFFKCYKVTFRFDNGNDDKIIYVYRNSKLSENDYKIRIYKDGFDFENWYLVDIIDGKEFVNENKFDFNNRINNDIVLIAKYTPVHFELVDTYTSIDQGDEKKLQYILEGTDDKPVFKSLNEDIVTVDGDGVIRGIKSGHTFINATVNGISLELSVDVNPIELDIITKDIYLNEGDSTFIKYNVKGSKNSVNWTSNNVNICTVSHDGKISGISSGTCIITGNIDNVYENVNVVVKYVDNGTVKIKSDKSVVHNGEVANISVLINNAKDKNVNYSSSGECFVWSMTTMTVKRALTSVCPLDKDGYATITASLSNGSKSSVTISLPGNK